MRREKVIGPYILCVIFFICIMHKYIIVREPVIIPEFEATAVVEEITIDIPEPTTEEETTIETTKDNTIIYSTENTTSQTTNTTKVSTTSQDNSSKGGVWYVTAYCPCSKCCGKYANSNTRYDENGNEYHVGASGSTLIAGYSVASNLPFGTKIYLEGIGEVCVTDRGVRGNHLDLYFNTHADALAFRTGRYSGYIIGG